jgi:hypothetical protein
MYWDEVRELLGRDSERLGLLDIVLGESKEGEADLRTARDNMLQDCEMCQTILFNSCRQIRRTAVSCAATPGSGGSGAAGGGSSGGSGAAGGGSSGGSGAAGGGSSGGSGAAGGGSSGGSRAAGGGSSGGSDAAGGGSSGGSGAAGGGSSGGSRAAGGGSSGGSGAAGGGSSGGSGAAGGGSSGGSGAAGGGSSGGSSGGSEAAGGGSSGGRQAPESNLLWFITDRVQCAGGVFDFKNDQQDSLTYGQITGPDIAGAIVHKPPQWTMRFRSSSDLISALDGQRTLLFIHGYNVKFRDAVLSAIKLKDNMNHGGPVVLYSWASHGSATCYLEDKYRAEATVPRLRSVLDMLLGRQGPLIVVAHSMGNRALSRVLAERGPLQGSSIRVMCAAADVDRECFRERMAKIDLGPTACTLYCAANDTALWLSRYLRLGKPRAGDCSGCVCVAPHFATVDCTNKAEDIDTYFHGYVFRRPAVGRDMQRAAIGDGPQLRTEQDPRTLLELQIAEKQKVVRFWGIRWVSKAIMS